MVEIHETTSADDGHPSAQKFIDAIKQLSLIRSDDGQVRATGMFDERAVAVQDQKYLFVSRLERPDKIRGDWILTVVWLIQCDAHLASERPF